MIILVINCGSSSVKYRVLNTSTGAQLDAGKIERVGEQTSHQEALRTILTRLGDYPIEGIGHRVVHGGEQFRQAVMLNTQVIDELRNLSSLAPLHNPANIAGIEAARVAFPSIPQVAVFDTAFHATMPRRAFTYAIDPSLAKRLNLRRFGFHGPSHKFVAQQAAAYLDADLADLKVISCHLGNGASVCAIEYGQSVETSMGMTPLEGLVMGTRAGDLDPAIVLELQRAAQLSADQIDTLLNKESGLKGLTGTDSDMRNIEARAANGDDRARLAVTVFCHRVKKYIGAYAATMGGVDVVVMTGGIGENSAMVRRRVLQRMQYLGLHVDEDLNANAKLDSNTRVAALHYANSKVKALAIATNEELMIARETANIIDGRDTVANTRSIPIAMSARHVHLNEATLFKLFGPGSEITKYKDISQPGQFAGTQQVNLIGPKGRIDGVRVLGPLRSKNQIEISRTDEFHLGVDAPVRRSGQTTDSAPITLEGPHGKVDLDEGLICAWRHIHMTQADAEHFGVKSGEYVEVAITGGERDLIYQDVLVRVAPAYVLEMHIDTDEANAAELGQHAKGDLVYTALGGHAQAEIKRRRV